MSPRTNYRNKVHRDPAQAKAFRIRCRDHIKASGRKVGDALNAVDRSRDWYSKAIQRWDTIEDGTRELIAQAVGVQVETLTRWWREAGQPDLLPGEAVVPEDIAKQLRGTR